MISSKNIGKLLKIIKNSKKNENIYLQISKLGIKETTKNRKHNFSIVENKIINNLKLNNIYESILEILVPILRKNNKIVIAQIGQSID